MMFEKSIEVRLGLARGHWGLGEFEEGVRSLARAIQEQADHADIPEVLATFLVQTEGRPEFEHLVERLRALQRAVERARDLGPRAEDEETPAGLATSTLAELLERQGHTERALAVAAEVLRRNPADARARAVCDRLLPEQASAPEPEPLVQPVRSQPAVEARPAPLPTPEFKPTPPPVVEPAPADPTRLAQIQALEGWLHRIERSLAQGARQA